MASRDWTQVPDELLDSIAARLSLPDILLFGAVCKAWQSVQAGRRSPRMPWLMLPVESYAHATFLDPSTGEFHRVAMPDDSKLIFEDSKDGWILAHDYNDAFLLNPLTKARISLPPLKRSWICTRFGMKSFSKLRFCCSPADGDSSSSSSSYSFTVAALGFRWVAILREQDTEWMVLDPDLFSWCVDLIQYEGKIHALMGIGQVQAWDLSGAFPVRTLQTTCLYNEKDLSMFHKRLVDCAGDLLQAWIHKRVIGCKDGDVFRIFKLDRDAASWIPTMTLDACSLFFGKGQCIALPASLVPNLRANHVYLSEQYEKRNSRGFLDEFCAGLLDLNDKSFDAFYSRVLKPPESDYAPTLWFAPNPL